MKFLLDMPVSMHLCQWLRTQDHEATHVSQIGMASASDIDIIKLAKEQRSIIITADLDFSRLIALAGESSPALILFWGGNYKETELKALLDHTLRVISEQDLEKSIVVVDKTRIRKITLPIH